MIVFLIRNIYESYLLLASVAFVSSGTMKLHERRVYPLSAAETQSHYKQRFNLHVAHEPTVIGSKRRIILHKVNEHGATREYSEISCFTTLRQLKSLTSRNNRDICICV